MPGIPKPEFKSCDETSLSLKLNVTAINGLDKSNELRLEYKLHHEAWPNAKHLIVQPEHGNESSVNI